MTAGDRLRLQRPPRKAKQHLIDYYHHAEQMGYWGPQMRRVLIALIPKPGATHEGQLRPRGILPMLHRIYMKIRRHV